MLLIIVDRSCPAVDESTQTLLLPLVDLSWLGTLEAAESACVCLDERAPAGRGERGGGRA
ncbi:hypothetical protein [Parafrankia sp. EAN1pec]|uniref:hypothetical protein n=1 Tax=Parafrankia sp. (strain EAN1pec) TaxID=298653 RepID=UPI00321A7F95